MKPTTYSLKDENIINGGFEDYELNKTKYIDINLTERVLRLKCKVAGAPKKFWIHK